MSVLEIVLLLLTLNLAMLSLYLNHQLQVRKAQLHLVRESRWQMAQALHQAQDSARQADHNATLRSRPN